MHSWGVPHGVSYGIGHLFKLALNTPVYSIIDKCKELDNLMNATNSALKVPVPRT